MTRPLKVVGQLGALALVLGLLGLLVWKIASDDAPVANVGKPVPRFDLPSLSGDEPRAPRERHFETMKTGVPTFTCWNSHSASEIRMRMQPCETE